jgi:hypothetical protein
MPSEFESIAGLQRNRTWARQAVDQLHNIESSIGRHICSRLG